MKKYKINVVFLSTLLACLFLFTSCSNIKETKNPNNVKLDPKSPTAVSVWHYYSGAQQEAFNKLVTLFNNTVGKEKGIVVEGFSQGNVSDLEKSVLDSVNKNVGADTMPSIFAAYADTAYMVDSLNYAVDLSPYLTKEEVDSFIGSYLEEGRFKDDNSLKIFPVAKSVEIFLLNKTDWNNFSEATGVSTSDFSTFEGLTKLAKQYYDWTDSLTKTPEDGKAFFGRDAMANFLIVGSKQLGSEIFNVKNGESTLNFDKNVIKKIWDNYYVPYINGYFSSSGRFRSDDIKTGNIISFIGSSSGASFFPDKVILSDNESYPIEMEAFECPQFENGFKTAIQQGAGMVVTKTNDKEIYASIEFLKWFTTDENNINFSIASGYLPVKKTSNNFEKIKSQIKEEDKTTISIISNSINTVNNNTLYTTKAFKNGTEARNILEFSLSDLAISDRKTVKNKISNGMKREEAVKEFESDEYFNSWYEKTKNELEMLMK